jgi:hypothetical protein
LVTIEKLIFTDFGSGGLMFNFCSRVLDIYIREGMCTARDPINKESHWEKLRALVALFITCTCPLYEFWECPADIPLDTILDLVFFPIWIILVPVSACW